jgi:hypothetical protein
MNCFRCYLIVAPKLIRPTTLYGVTITLLDHLKTENSFVSVRVEIRKDKLEMASATQNIPVSSTQTVFLQVRTDHSVINTRMFIFRQSYVALSIGIFSMCFWKQNQEALCFSWIALPS